MTLLKKKSGVYHAVVTTTKGTRKAITTGSRDKREAARIVADSGLADLERAAKAGRLTQQAIGHITTGKKLTVEKALAAHLEWMKALGRSSKTILNISIYLDNWLKHQGLATLPPTAITEQHVNDYVNSQEFEWGAANRTVILSAIRTFLDFTGAKGWTMGNPAKLVEVNLRQLSHDQKEPKNIEPFTGHEMNRLLKQVADDPFWPAAVRLSRETGLRLGDVCKLEWNSFEYPNKVVVWTSKRNKRVAVPISEELAELITTIPVSHPQYVFPQQRELAMQNRSDLSVYFSRILARCEITGKSFHSLRHTFCTELARKGLTLEDIGVLCGHSDTKTTEGYVH